MYNEREKWCEEKCRPSSVLRVDVRFPINRLGGVADEALHEPRLNFQRDRGEHQKGMQGAAYIHIPSYDTGC